MHTLLKPNDTNNLSHINYKSNYLNSLKNHEKLILNFYIIVDIKCRFNNYSIEITIS